MDWGGLPSPGVEHSPRLGSRAAPSGLGAQGCVEGRGDPSGSRPGGEMRMWREGQTGDGSGNLRWKEPAFLQL